MKISKFCFYALILYSSVFVQLVAQTTNRNLPRAKKDSLLNEITDIDKQLKNYVLKDRIGGYSVPLQTNQVSYYNDNSLNNHDVSQMRDMSGLLIVPNYWEPFRDNITFRDTIIFEPAFLPVVFDGRILPSDLNFLSKTSSNVIAKDYHLISPDNTFAPQLARAKEVQNMRRNYYMNNFEMIKLNALTFRNSPVISEERVHGKNPFQELLSTDNPVEVITPEIEKYEIRKVYWIKKGEHSLQINQNSVSDNWFTGGNNNLNVLSYHRVDINYKKNKITFNNTFDWKLNFQNNQADEFHKITIMEDFFRIQSVLGLEAYKQWSYATNLLVTTPLFNNYPFNSEHKRAAIFSPLNVNTGIGMKYSIERVSKKDKYRKLNYSAELSPISVNYIFVGDRGVDVKRFGIKEGKRSITDYGMTVKMNLNYSFNRFSTFNSRFLYFTNYQKAIMESENRFNLNLNRYLSTSLYLYVRYDDGVPIRGKFGYFQFNQILGFGLNYRWQ